MNLLQPVLFAEHQNIPMTMKKRNPHILNHLYPPHSCLTSGTHMAAHKQT